MGKFTIEFKWALVFAFVNICWMALEKAVGLHNEHVGRQVMYTNLFVLAAIPVYFLEMRDKKQNFYKGNMTWTQGFLSGVIASVIIAALSPAVQFVAFNWISPDFFENIRHHYVSHKIMTPGKAKAYFNTRSYNLQAISGGISLGVIISAVVALFVKSKHATPEPLPAKPTKTKKKRK